MEEERPEGVTFQSEKRGSNRKKPPEKQNNIR